MGIDYAGSTTLELQNNQRTSNLKETGNLATSQI